MAWNIDVDDAVSGELIESAWGNAVRDRVVHLVASSTGLPTSGITEGGVAYAGDDDTLWIRAGGEWRQIPYSGGPPITGPVNMGGYVIENVGDPLAKTTRHATPASWVNDRYLALDGAKPMTGQLGMGGNLIANVGDPLTKQTAHATPAKWVDDNYLAKTGGSITAGVSIDGVLSMNGNLIEGVGDPLTKQTAHATPAKWVDDNYLAKTGGSITAGVSIDGVLSMNGNLIEGVGDPVGKQTAHATPAKWVDDRYLALDGTNPMNGQLDMGGNRIAQVGAPAVGGDDHAMPRGYADNRYLRTDAPSFTDGNLTVHARLSTDALRPNLLWPYNTSGSTLRWQGTGSDIAQSFTASSLAYKKQVTPVDVDKSVFSDLEGIHFHYRKDAPNSEALAKESGHMGVAWEQVKDVDPSWAGEVDGVKAVWYESMLPDLIGDYLAVRAEVMELRSTVEAMAARLAALESVGA